MMANTYYKHPFTAKKRTEHSRSLSQEAEDIDRRFRIIDKIGEGTYGTVYRALDMSINKVNKIRFSIVRFSPVSPF